jgi:hypothetical protein
MVYGRRNVNTDRLGKFTARTKKKRTANTTKIRYMAPTAKNQKKQIMTNAKAITRLYKMAMPKQVYCDWQYVGQLFSELDPAGFTRTWGAFPLMSFGTWGQVLRQDDNVTESSTTYVRNLAINMRYFLQQSSWAQFNVFIVTPRRDNNNSDPPTQFAAGIFPNNPSDYVESPNAFNFRLNPAQFKVHFASYRTLTETTLFQAVQPNFPAGNPMTTFAKGQVNIPCKASIRQPSRSGSWRQLSYQSIPYYKRYFLLVCIVQNAPDGVQAGNGAQFAFDQLATTVNSS